jgi:hypothetical protein
MTSDGRYFTDAAHPTETGISVAISDLLRDERFRRIFPAIDPERLRPIGKRPLHVAMRLKSMITIKGNKFTRSLGLAVVVERNNPVSLCSGFRPGVYR